MTQVLKANIIENLEEGLRQAPIIKTLEATLRNFLKDLSSG